MDNLNLEEFDNWFIEFSSDIEYVEFDIVDTKIKQLLRFIETQPIGNNITSRIEKDFFSLGALLPEILRENGIYQNHEIFDNIIHPLDQGAFGYFIIKRAYNSNWRNHNIAWSIIMSFYGVSNADDAQEKFNVHIFRPLCKIVNWYLYKSKPKSESDYFSLEVSENIFSSISDRDFLDMGHEQLSQQIDELKELILTLNKKNFKEILIGKFQEQLLSPSFYEGVIKLVNELDK